MNNDLNLPDDLAAEKARIDALGGADAYPFDPKLNKRFISKAEGLDRLCYIEDRTMARSLYELWFGAQANARDPEQLAQRRRDEAKKRQDDLEWLSNVAKSCLAGAFGGFIRKEAELRLVGSDGQMYSDEATLRDWVSTVAAMDWKSGADATKRIPR